MFHLEDVLTKNEHEQVHAIIRRHASTLIPVLSVSLVLIAAPFFFLYQLFAWKTIGLILFFSSVVLGIVIALRALLLWDADVFVLTDLRVVDVDQQGILSRTVAETALSGIQDVAWGRKGTIQTLFRTGTLSIQPAGGGRVMVIMDIPRPERVYARLNELRHKKGLAASPVEVEVVDTEEVVEEDVSVQMPSAEGKAERIAEIVKMLNGYSEEELQRVSMILQARESSRDA